MADRYSDYYPDYTPIDGNTPRPKDVIGECSECGLELRPVMMYCCQHSYCPCGLGPKGYM